MGVRRPEWVLGAAVLVCSPMLPDVMNGSVQTTTALVRFLGALVVCWVAGGIITNVVDRYAGAAAQRVQGMQSDRAGRAQAGTADAPLTSAGAQGESPDHPDATAGQSQPVVGGRSGHTGPPGQGGVTS